MTPEELRIKKNRFAALMLDLRGNYPLWPKDPESWRPQMKAFYQKLGEFPHEIWDRAFERVSDVFTDRPPTAGQCKDIFKSELKTWEGIQAMKNTVPPERQLEEELEPVDPDVVRKIVKEQLGIDVPATDEATAE